MKILIDIAETTYTNAINRYNSGLRNTFDTAVSKGLTLPENPTNGDMIRALFPNNKYVEGEKFVIIQGVTENISLWNNWWNAPYKLESEDNNATR